MSNGQTTRLEMGPVEASNPALDHVIDSVHHPTTQHGDPNRIRM